jgi:hypothetical protein
LDERGNFIVRNVSAGEVDLSVEKIDASPLAAPP